MKKKKIYAFVDKTVTIDELKKYKGYQFMMRMPFAKKLRMYSKIDKSFLIKALSLHFKNCKIDITEDVYKKETLWIKLIHHYEAN